MGRIISLINVTPDGYADAKYTIPGAEYYDMTHELLQETATVAMGRKTFELFQDLWPARMESEHATAWQKKMAMALNDIPKVVFSASLQTTTWNNSKIIEQINIAYINAFKQAGKGGLLTFGSISLVETLTQMKLIDDYYFCVQPFIAGSGDVRLFDKVKLDMPNELKYAGSKSLQSGVHVIHYQLNNK